MKKLHFTFFLVVGMCFFTLNVKAQELPTKFYGKYVSNVCDACHWTFKDDGTGTWSVGLRSGNEQISFIWEAMIDKNGDLQLAKRGNETGYALKITYMSVPLSNDVKGTLISAQRDNAQAMGVLWFNDQDIVFQFLAETNGFYEKI
ncbi:MAG: hypothetical protein RQ735_11045 [Flavobacteriaceae bacterium]|nr:hypothetical protein [Flavobacteriaceae bacterium]